LNLRTVAILYITMGIQQEEEKKEKTPNEKKKFELE
jgi:hypothetical protein